MQSYLVYCLAAWAVVSVGIGCAAFVGASSKPIANALAIGFLWLPILAIVCALGVVAIPALPVWAVFTWFKKRRRERAIAAFARVGRASRGT